MSRGTGEASQTDPSKPDVRATSTQGIARSARRGSLMRSTTKSPTCSSLGGADGIVEVVAQIGTSVEGVEADAGGGKRRPVHAPKGRLSTRGDCGGGPTYLVGVPQGESNQGAAAAAPSLGISHAADALEPGERTDEAQAIPWSPGGVVRGPTMSTWNERGGWKRCLATSQTMDEMHHRAVGFTPPARAPIESAVRPSTGRRRRLPDALPARSVVGWVASPHMPRSPHASHNVTG